LIVWRGYDHFLAVGPITVVYRALEVGDLQRIFLHQEASSTAGCARREEFGEHGASRTPLSKQRNKHYTHAGIEAQR